MQLLKSVVTAIALITVGAEAAANFFSVDLAANMAAVRNGGDVGATHIYYQASNGAIMRICASTAFIRNGAQNCDNVEVVPPEEVMFDTPLAVSTLLTSKGGFHGNHVYYFSRDGILSEYINNIAAHGPNCADCVTNEKFGVARGSKALYTIADETKPGMQLRVGFESTESPGTITEATFNANTRKWSLTVLPN
ncbi:hypothetical protein VKT23_008741 [Stygiomarasmius scandens]|uniref:Fucose-specific lectin n=1 Tax=Marasmiellus scandens TaxID=2682957 RepID=A0ABR1JIS6_9AGAR